VFGLRLEFLLPSAVFGRAVKLDDFGEGNDQFVFSFGSHTPASRISAEFFNQIAEAEENAPCRDEPNDGLTTFEALDQVTDPLGHPGPYASGKQCFFFIFEGL